MKKPREPEKRSESPNPLPVWDVICKKIQLAFYLEKTVDGKAAGEFEPYVHTVYASDFSPVDLTRLASDVCRLAKEKLEKK